MAIGFHCRAEERNQSLDIYYRVENRSRSEYGLFNRIPGSFPDGAHDFSPHIAYVELEGGRLTVRKAVLALPPNLRATHRVVPLVTSLAPGDDFEETIRLPIPVRVCHPYRRVLTGGEVVADTVASASSLFLSIGAFMLEGVRLRAHHPAFPAVLSPVPPGPAVARQELLERALPLGRAIPVLDYRGVPWT